MEHPHYGYRVVGAGPSGLTLANKLLQKQRKVLVLERDPRVGGGVVKSHNHDGQIFDTGPKRFHTGDPIVMNCINEIIKGDALRIRRSAKVYFFKEVFRVAAAIERPTEAVYSDLNKMRLGSFEI